jgi:hypothetical protein
MQKKWSLWGAALWGFVLMAFTALTSGLANGWQDLSALSHAHLRGALGYLFGRFAVIPLIFVLLVFIRNRFVRAEE